MPLEDFSKMILMPLIIGQLPAQDKVAVIIEERGGLMGTGRYGPFIDNAIIAQDIKETFRATPNWDKLNAAQKEGLDLIAMKISRILSGDPDYEDNWLDAEGYLRLARHKWEKDR